MANRLRLFFTNHYITQRNINKMPMNTELLHFEFAKRFLPIKQTKKAIQIKFSAGEMSVCLLLARDILTFHNVNKNNIMWLAHAHIHEHTVQMTSTPHFNPMRIVH